MQFHVFGDVSGCIGLGYFDGFSIEREVVVGGDAGLGGARNGFHARENDRTQRDFCRILRGLHNCSTIQSLLIQDGQHSRHDA